MLLAIDCAVAVGIRGERPTAGSDEGKQRQPAIPPSSYWQFKFERTNVVNCRMASLPIVVVLDVVADALHRLCSRLIIFPMNEFDLQCSIEALHGRVVVTVAFAAHARLKTMHLWVGLVLHCLVRNLCLLCYVRDVVSYSFNIINCSISFMFIMFIYTANKAT